MPVFGEGVEAVYVDVFASSEGKPLTGLVASDFEVRDGGVVQSVELLSQELAPLHALLLLDTSSTLAGGTLESLKQAGRAFLAGLREADRLSWLTADKVLGVARESGASIYAVDTTQAQARLEVPRATERRNDAMGNRGGFLTGQRSQDLSTGALKPETAPPTFLQRAADETGGRVLQAGRGDLQVAFLSLLGELTSRYTLRYAPPGAPRPGWHELSVHLKGKKGELRVRRGYFVPTPPSAGAS